MAAPTEEIARRPRQRGKAGTRLKKVRQNRLTTELNLTLPLEIVEVSWGISQELQKRYRERGEPPESASRAELIRAFVLDGYEAYLERGVKRFLASGLDVADVVHKTRLTPARIRQIAARLRIPLPNPDEAEDTAYHLVQKVRAQEAEIVALRAALANEKRRNSAAKNRGEQGAPESSVPPASVLQT